jgi:CheY-like chemotaxis protein
VATVLVLNDEHSMLDAYEAVLRELGHEVVTKTLSVQALRRSATSAQRRFSSTW